MLLAWDNTSDAATLAAGSEIATLPGANVQQPHLSRRWNTAAGVKTSFLVFDMLASVAMRILMVVGTNLTPTATYRVRASDADPNAVATLLLDTGTLAAGVKAGYGAIYKLFTLTVARYWRVDLTDNNVPSNLQIGRVRLMPVWIHSGSLTLGWGVAQVDPSPVVKSRGGQSFPDTRPKYRAIDFTLDFLTEAEIFDNAFALARSNGVTKDVLVMPRETGAYVSEQSVWGLVKESQPVFHRLTNEWTQKFRIEERL